MARIRASWFTIGNYKIWIFTTWQEKNTFKVKLIRTSRDVPKLPEGPDTPPWFEYIENRFYARSAVVHSATERARSRLLDERAAIYSARN